MEQRKSARLSSKVDKFSPLSETYIDQALQARQEKLGLAYPPPKQSRYIRESEDASSSIADNLSRHRDLSNDVYGDTTSSSRASKKTKKEEERRKFLFANFKKHIKQTIESSSSSSSSSLQTLQLQDVSSLYESILLEYEAKIGKKISDTSPKISSYDESKYDEFLDSQLGDNSELVFKRKRGRPKKRRVEEEEEELEQNQEEEEEGGKEEEEAVELPTIESLKRSFPFYQTQAWQTEGRARKGRRKLKKLVTVFASRPSCSVCGNEDRNEIVRCIKCGCFFFCGNQQTCYLQHKRTSLCLENGL